jgi:hypothetical protein
MSSVSRWGKFLLPAILGLSSLLLLSYAVNVIGPNIGFFHDELWEITPSVAMLRGDSRAFQQEINIFGTPVPLVSGPYQGAYKTWIAAPFLQIFGTSPQSILTLNLLLSMVCLALLYWAILPAAGPLWASLAFAAPLVDTNFLLTGPMDTGPFLFQSMFICLAMGTLFRYAAVRRRKYLWLTWLFAGGILAQKLTAIPVVLAFAILIAVMSAGRVREVARLRGLRSAVIEHLLIPSGLFLVPLIPHLAYLYKTGLVDLFSMTADAEKLPYFSALNKCIAFFQSMSGGTDWYQRITLDDTLFSVRPSMLAIAGALVTVCFIVTWLLSGDRLKDGRWGLLCLLLGLVSFSIYPLVPGLFRPWHFYILSPIFFGGCVIFTSYCCLRWSGKFRSHSWIPRAALVVGFAVCVGLGVSQAGTLLRGIEEHGGVCQTSPALYDIYYDILNAGIGTVYAVNYSLADPIYVLSKGRIRTIEMAWTELTPDSVEEMIHAIETDPKIGIVYRYCGCTTSDQDWIRWLNRDPDLFAFIHRLEREGGTLEFVRRRDTRLTEFVLIRRQRPLE